MSIPGIRVDWEFNIEPKEIVSRAENLISRIRKVYDTAATLKTEEISFENLLKVLADAECEYTSERYYLDFPQQVATCKEIRDASTEADKMMQEFDVETSMRQDIFNNLVFFQSTNPELESEYHRYLERLIKLGRRNGLHLDTHVQDEIKSLKSKTNDLCIQFHKNLTEENTALEFSDSDLEGLPEEFISNLDLLENGKRKVTLKYPHYFPIMRNAKNPNTRQKIEHAFNSRCMDTNAPKLEEIISLRHKHAKLLGFPNHAAYIADFRMAKSQENIYNFLTDLANKLAPHWEKEEAYLLQLKKEDCEEQGIPFDGTLRIYDLRYYTTKVEEIQFNVDQNQLRKYFPLPILIQRLLDIYQLILGLKFKEMEGAKTWHPDVKLFSVEDADSNQLLGYFFMDLFCREGKYTHEAMFELQPGCLLADGTRQVSIAALVANFTRTKANDKPSLLDHSELTTFFHEFGHVMHQICAQAKLSNFNGTNVERDFVEAPSQMLENWCWEPESLRWMSSHHLDGTPIPDDLVDLLIKSRKANTAYNNLRQIVLAMFDHVIHTKDEADSRELFCELHKKYLNIEPSPGTNFATNFGHLTGGYDAQYYCYMWSEVYSMDMFSTRFKKEGILSPEVGKAYREKILKPGGSKDAIDMLKEFLGREPTPEAFLISKGLQAEK